MVRIIMGLVVGVVSGGVGGLILGIFTYNIVGVWWDELTANVVASIVLLLSILGGTIIGFLIPFTVQKEAVRRERESKEADCQEQKRYLSGLLSNSRQLFFSTPDLVQYTS